jgi:hypothetical protein
MTSRYLSLKGNTTDVTSGAQSANPSGAPEFIPSFSVVRVARSLMFGVVFCRSLFVPLAIALSVRRLFTAFDYSIVLSVLPLCTAFDYPMYFLSFFCLLLLITPLFCLSLFCLRLLITPLYCLSFLCVRLLITPSYCLSFLCVRF